MHIFLKCSIFVTFNNLNVTLEKHNFGRLAKKIQKPNLSSKKKKLKKEDYN